MASFFKRYGKWHAKRTRFPLHYHLGYYHTKEEAIAVEKAFDARNPSRRGKGRIHASH